MNINFPNKCFYCNLDLISNKNYEEKICPQCETYYFYSHNAFFLEAVWISNSNKSYIIDIDYFQETTILYRIDTICGLEFIYEFDKILDITPYNITEKIEKMLIWI